MKSFTTLKALFTNLSNNTSTSNATLGAQLINDQHRYLLQKYFSNETTFSITTVGAQDLTLTGALSAGDISATLTTAWAYYTTKVQVTSSSGEIRMCNVISGSTSLTWDAPLTESATTAIEVGGLQYYPLPPNYSKLKSLTITVGNLKWTPKEILTLAEWNELNVFPYYSDIPNNFYIFPGGDHGAQVGIWPIPSTTGNVITFGYKFRVPDLSVEDYTTPGAVTVTKGSAAVTATGTSFPVTVNPQLESRWIKFAAPNGDNLWYQIANISSTTALTLYQPYQGNTISGATAGTYTIGQMPLLMEDFHDMLVYGALKIYYSSIKPDQKRAQEFKELYEERLKLLEEYSGGNTIDVNLARGPIGMNPNLFQQDIGS